MLLPIGTGIVACPEKQLRDSPTGNHVTGPCRLLRYVVTRNDESDIYAIRVSGEIVFVLAF